MTFENFVAQVSKRLNLWISNNLPIYVTVNGDAVWERYLEAFPEGSNPIFVKRRVYECNVCRNFLRNVGNIVIINSAYSVETLWQPDSDYQSYELEDPFQTVAYELDNFVRRADIAGPFLKPMDRYGQPLTRVEHESSGKTFRWEHFNVRLNTKYFKGKETDAEIGKMRAAVQVFRRGLEELTPDSFNTFIELSESPNGLYRGTEFVPAIKGLRDLQKEYKSLPVNRKRDRFVWVNCESRFARVRNTAAGTFLINISNGEDLEKAVAVYETAVAPGNYKRSSALITPKMIEQAMDQIKSLNLTEALSRRFAKADDVTIDNVLWADSSTQSRMKTRHEELGDLLLSSAHLAMAKRFKVLKDGVLSMDSFVEDVLPQAAQMEVLFKNRFKNNLMSVTAPASPDAERLFKWDNNFAWSYTGNVTDSIKERVKKAGGNVEAKLRVSLAWFNTDDLDVHIIDPDNTHIYFNNRKGILDVDANCFTVVTDPVENLAFQHPKRGTYKVWVNQFNRRSRDNVGFEIQLVDEHETRNFNYSKGVSGEVPCFTFTYDGEKITEVKVSEGLESGGSSSEAWGINTETFVKVNMMMLSPNFWDGQQIGNKHWFFILDKCQNPDSVRGIYNEYLRSELETHRKVFEVLSAKTQCEPTADQLSGLGFSVTRREEITVRVTNRNGDQRMLNVKI